MNINCIEQKYKKYQQLKLFSKIDFRKQLSLSVNKKMNSTVFQIIW